MKGTRKRHEINAKIEAKRYHNFTICSLMRLKFGKVVHWNLLFIVRKRQKLNCPHEYELPVTFLANYAINKRWMSVFLE